MPDDLQASPERRSFRPPAQKEGSGYRTSKTWGLNSGPWQSESGSGGLDGPSGDRKGTYVLASERERGSHDALGFGAVGFNTV